jgi:hypothetical protein
MASSNDTVISTSFLKTKKFREISWQPYFFVGFGLLVLLLPPDKNNAFSSRFLNETAV